LRKWGEGYYKAHAPAKKKEREMTREEILRMKASPELDRLVAERVMGWREGQKETLQSLKCGIGILGEKALPRYSTDIAEAWKVVDKMLDGGWACEIYSPNNPYALEDTDKWAVVFARCELLDHRAEASSAPLAICRAALLAVLEVKNE